MTLKQELEAALAKQRRKEALSAKIKRTTPKSVVSYLRSFKAYVHIGRRVYRYGRSVVTMENKLAAELKAALLNLQS